MSIGLITKLAKITDKLFRMTGVNGSDELAYTRGGPVKAATTVKTVIDGMPVSIWEFAELATGYSTGGDPLTWNWTPAFMALHASKPKSVLIKGKYRLEGGLSPTLYEWTDTTFVFVDAEIELINPVGDVVGLQIGSNCVGYGKLRGRVNGGVPNNNGFVQNPMCIGRWYDAGAVTNVHFDTLDMQGMSGGTAMAIAGNTSGVRIERLIMNGGGQLGLMMHWTGTPNNIAPTATYHPHDITIGSVIGSNFTEAMITASACYGLNIGSISGGNNYRDFYHIGGDFGDSLAIARDKGKVCKNIMLGSVTTRLGLYRAIEYNASAGKIVYVMEGDFSFGRVIAQGTGLINSVGIRVEDRKSGTFGVADVSGFASNINYINCNGGVDSQLLSSMATNQGITFAGTKNMQIGTARTKNDNQAAGGGVGGVNLTATCQNIDFDLIRVETNNAATHGCVLTSGATGIRIKQTTGTVDPTRVLLVDNGVANTNRIGPCITDAGAVSYSGPDPAMNTNARGQSISWGGAEPINGTFKRGDLYIASSPTGGGKAARICTTAGVAGSTAVFKQWGVIDA